MLRWLWESLFGSGTPGPPLPTPAVPRRRRYPKPVLDPVDFDRTMPAFDPAQRNLAERDLRQTAVDTYVANAAPDINDIARNPFYNRMFQGISYNEPTLNWNQPYPNTAAAINAMLQPHPADWEAGDYQYAAIFIWYLCLAMAMIMPTTSALQDLYVGYNYHDADNYKKAVVRKQLLFLAGMTAMMFTDGIAYVPTKKFKSIRMLDGRCDYAPPVHDVRARDRRFNAANRFLHYIVHDHFLLRNGFRYYGITKDNIIDADLSGKWTNDRHRLVTKGYWSMAFVNNSGDWDSTHRLSVRAGLYIGYHRICDSLFRQWSYKEGVYQPEADSLRHAELSERQFMATNPCIYQRPRITVTGPPVAMRNRGFP